MTQYCLDKQLIKEDCTELESQTSLLTINIDLKQLWVNLNQYCNHSLLEF